MNLGEFYDQIRDALGRGNSLDAQIVTYTRQAARWIERNGNYKYMEQFGTLTLNPNAAFPHILDSPSPTLKSIIMFRIVRADGRYHYLRKIDPRDNIYLEVARPKGYSLAGVSKIILDSKPGEPGSCELIWNQFTAWPTDLTAENWLLDNAEDVLTAQTLILMAPWLRDPRMVQTYKATRDECLHTLESSEIDMNETNADDVMQFGVGSVS